MRKTLVPILSILMAISLSACGGTPVTEETPVSIAVFAPCSSIDCDGQNQADLIGNFNEAGFRNIETERVEDLAYSDADMLDTVLSVSIAGQTDFTQGQEFDEDDEVRICYHAFRKCNVAVHVDFVPNLIFSKYDVNFLLNSSKQDRLEHGVDKDIEITVDPGEYIITFESADSSSVKGEVVLTIDCDIDASFKITCFSEKVSVETLYVDRLTTLAEGEVKMDVSVSDYEYQNYSVVEASLRSLGFTNIKYNILYDIIWGVTENGEVKSVSIGGNSSFTRGCVFSADDEIVITYHMPIEDDPTNITLEIGTNGYKGQNYLEVEQAFKDMGFKDIELSEVSTNNQEYSDGEVFSVTIGGTSYDAGEWTTPDSKVRIKYYSVEVPEVIEIITIDNNEDFADILNASYVDPEKQATFISKYEGQIVEFDCIVFYLEQYGNYDTRYNYVLVPGEDENNIGAALFYLENIGMFDFKWDSSTRPDYLTAGSKIRIQAEVLTGDDPLYIYLEPICTWGR